MTRFTLLSVILLTLFAGSVALADTYQGVIRFDPADLTIQEKLGFHTLELKDGASSVTVGAPAVPKKTINVALPTDAKVRGVKVIDVETRRLEGEFDIMPAAQPIHISGTKLENPFVKDDSIYGVNQDFPGAYAERVNTWDLAGQDFVSVAFYPVQYNPVSKKLSLATTIRFQIEYESSENPVRETYNYNDKNRAHVSKVLRRMAHNPEDVSMLPEFNPSHASRALDPGDYEYVIVTTNSFSSGFQTLADWRNQMGMPAKVVTTSYIYSNYSGTNQERIRAFIIDAAATWGTMFVLLGGDTNYIPHSSKTVMGDNIPNDTFYGDYDDDWKYEVYIGRASVNNTSQITTFVNKVLTYEKNPPNNYGNKVFFMAFDADAYTPDEECKIKIKNETIPSYALFVKEYDSESGGHESDVKNYMNQGQNLVNHIDHGETSSLGVGSYNHWSWLSTSEAQNFSNGTKYSNFYTVACEVAKYNSNCWAEYFVRDDQGGITFVGNSRYGWYTQGNTNTYSAKYDQLWWKELYNNNSYRAGETFAEHLNAYTPFDPTYKYIYTELNLFGDPALHLWTKNPTNMTVTHNSTVYTGPQNFTVNVKYLGTNIQGALVCAMKGTDVYAYGTTNASGNATLSISPATTGNMTVTVTAQNYKYYQGTVSVASGSNPPTVSVINPNCGPMAGNTAVTVVGTNFTASPPMTVLIGGNPCTNVSVTNATTLTCNTPTGAEGWQNVQVSNLYGSDTLTGYDGFRYFPILTTPYNCTNKNTTSLDTPVDVVLIVSGNSNTPFLLYYSLGGGPLPSAFGTAGLDMPIYSLFMSDIGLLGYRYTNLSVPAGYGPLTFYMQVLGMDGTGKPKFATGGGNPYGSIEFNLNN